MATRNLTAKYEALRSSLKRVHRESLSYPSDPTGKTQLLTAGSSDDDSERVAMTVGLSHSLPPEWVDIVGVIQKNIADIKSNIRHLQKLHGARLKVSFGTNESEQEREIEILTQEISRLFHSCENNLKRIAIVGNTSGQLPVAERTVRLNVMRSLATEIQELSKNFRHTQKDFLLRLKGQEEVGNEFFVDDSESKTPLSFGEALDRGFSEEKMRQLQSIKSSASQREKEIITLCQSINELATIFRELSVLVVEQGSVLDRIDYNLERTLVQVQAGNKELKQADEKSKTPRLLICMFVMFIIIVVLMIILIKKKS